MRAMNGYRQMNTQLKKRTKELNFAQISARLLGLHSSGVGKGMTHNIPVNRYDSSERSALTKIVKDSISKEVAFELSLKL